MKRLARVLVTTPHPWGVPHPVNDHIAELAEGLASLRRGGDAGVPDVVVIAPSLDPVALRTTRYALKRLARGDAPDMVFADPRLRPVGTKRRPMPVSDIPVLALGLPLGNASVALRSSLRIVMEHSGASLVYAHDPLHSDLTRYIIRSWQGLTMAMVHELPASHILQHLTAPLRDRLLEAVDQWVVPALDEDGFAGNVASFVGVAREQVAVVPSIASRVPEGRREPATARIVVARGSEDDAHVRDIMRQLASLEASHADMHVTLVSRWSNHHRPRVPVALRGRCDVIRAESRAAAEDVLRAAAVCIAVPGTPVRLIAEAHAVGVPVARYPISDSEIHLHLRKTDRPVDLPEHVAPGGSELAQSHLGVMRSLLDRQHVRVPVSRRNDRTCIIDLHMHTSHSWDCATDPEALLFVARKVGLTAIAVTDHNEISGALACAELADEYGIQVIVGEEVKTAEGEVIGLFLSERIEPGLSWHDTIQQIRAQDGLVYVPHPFDRLHTIPSARTLRDSIDEIDAFETYNARLAFEQFNRDAARFARKYNLIEGAGSDAHVVQGLGTAAVRMPAWDDPEGFLMSLRQGEILRRPKNLLYLQGLKWINDVSGRSKQQPAEIGD